MKRIRFAKRFRIDGLRLTLAVGYILAAGPAWAADVEEQSAMAQVAMPELLLGVGTRATAMGSAGAADAQEVSALYWNPAGLSRIHHGIGEFVHHAWIQGINQETLIAGVPLWPQGTAALGLNYLSLGTVEKTGIQPDGSIQLFNAELNPSLLSMTAGLGAQLFFGWAAGAALKFVSQNLGETAYSTAAVDVGLQGEIIKNFRVGATLTQAGFAVADFPLPLTTRFGAAYDFQPGEQHRILAAADVSMPLQPGQVVDYHLGVEYAHRQLLFIRTGYQLTPASRQAVVAGLTAGLGLSLNGWTLAYTFAPQGGLGQSHRVALAVDFTRIAELAAMAPAAPPRRAATPRRPEMRSSQSPALALPRTQAAPIQRSPMATPGVKSVNPDEEAMRSLLEENLQVETRIKRTRERLEVKFSFKRGPGPRIARWHFTLSDRNGKPLRNYQGKGMPSQVVWDGLDEAGARVAEDEAIQFQLQLEDVTGQTESRNGRLAASPTPDGGQRAVEAIPVSQTFGEIYFESNQAEVLPDAAKKIARAAAFMAKHAQAKVSVEGFADPATEADKALILSKARAEAVARYLTAYHKISLARLLIRGRGTATPPGSETVGPAQRRCAVITVQETP